MYPVYSVAQMRAAEERAGSEYGVALTTLMDAAGAALAREALAMLGSSVTRVEIFCGSGNNGGDGYVCGAELLARGVPVTIVAVGADTLAPGSLAGAAADRYRAAGGEILAATDTRALSDLAGGPPSRRDGSRGPAGRGAVSQAPGTLIVDALLGTGLGRPVTGLYAHLIEVINASRVPVLACDVPSGVDADTGAVLGPAVRADRTVVMGLAKPACILDPGRALCGEIIVADIGLPDALVASLGQAVSSRSWSSR